MNRQLQKDIESDVVQIAKIIKPQLTHLPVIDGDSGEKVEFKQFVKTYTMNGTTQDYNLDPRYAFENYDKVHFGLTADTFIALKARMLNKTKFRIEAASAVTNLTIKVYITGN